MEEYSDAAADLQSWAASLPSGAKVMLTKPSMYLTGASYSTYEAVTAEKVALDDSPVLVAKNVKNAVRLIEVTRLEVILFLLIYFFSYVVNVYESKMNHKIIVTT